MFTIGVRICSLTLNPYTAVLRFLLSKGFHHTTFTFQQESRADALDVQNGDVQPGALINLIQKGLLYMDIETHMNPVSWGGFFHSGYNLYVYWARI